MWSENKSGLDVLDLRLRLKGRDKIKVDVYSKPTNTTFTEGTLNGKLFLRSVVALHMSTVGPVNPLEM